MIKVRIVKKGDVIESIYCNGHANYADYGKDMINEVASTKVVINGLAITAGSNPIFLAIIGSVQPINLAMIITTINGILEIDKDAISYTDTNNLEIINIKKDNITNSLLRNLVNMIKELKENYDKNINIKEENHE